MASKEEKPVPISIHDTDMRSLGAQVRVAIGYMVMKATTGGLEDSIEKAIRSTRRRWDELCPTFANEKDRKSLTKSLSEKRAAWDQWFGGFMCSQESVESLNEQIDIVNDTYRDGVNQVAPIQRVDVPSRARAERLSSGSLNGAERSTGRGGKGAERPAERAERPAERAERTTERDKYVAENERENRLAERDKYVASITYAPLTLSKKPVFPTM